MVTLVGGNAKLIDLSQEDIDALLEGITRDPTPEELAEAHEPKIGYCLERLLHFRCGVCNGWWSISDWHARAKGRTTLCCPWCGIEQEVAA